MSDQNSGNATDNGAQDNEQGQQDQNQPDNGGNMIPKHRFDEVNQKRKDAEESLQSVVSDMTEDIPEEFRSLVPKLTPTEQIKWIREAQKNGLFTKTPAASGPDSKRPGSKGSDKALSPYEQYLKDNSQEE